MKRVLVAMLLGLVAAAGACSDSPSSPSSSSSSSTSSSGSSGGARVSVRLTAGPFDSAKAILVTFSRVRLYRGSPSNFTDVALSGGGGQYTCDLKKLQSTDAEIAVGSLPAGAYSQIGLVIQSAAVYIDSPTANAACAASIPAPGGRSAALSVPGSEIPLPRNFDLNGDAVLRLSFDTEQSIHVIGENSFSFSPVLSVLGVS